MQITRIF